MESYLFFLLAITSTFAYALQSSLLAHHARSMDKLSLAFYRMLALSIILLPMLSQVAINEYQQLIPLLPALALSGISGGLFLWTQFYALKFLPIGVSSSLSQSMRTLASFLLSYHLLDESLSISQAAFICLVLFGSCIVAISKNKMNHLSGNTNKGVLITVVSGSLGALSFFSLSYSSKIANPYMIGYFWEFSVLLGAASILLMRTLVTSKKRQVISIRQFGIIALASSPTLIGTICAALALQQGPLAIFMAIAAISVILSAIFGRLLYKETLVVWQWFGILLSLVGVVCLKLYSS